MTKRTFLFIDVTVKLIEPLHISGKSDPFTTAHNRMTRVGDDVVIPGPSFKGALRFSLERLLSANYSQKEWMKPCLPATGRNTSDDEKTLKNQRKYRNNPCSYEKNSTLCPVCYLLGAMGLPGIVYVPFLFTDTLPEELYSLRLDRATGTGVHGTNREYEFVPAGSVFKGTIEVLEKDEITGWTFGQPRPLAKNRNADKWLIEEDWDRDRILNKLLIPALEGITRMGGFRSKGFGKVEVTASMRQDAK
jgi:CRISPR/Cas system CSM-associated protein Csm3 (group 7 of RAMP superfamily)